MPGRLVTVRRDPPPIGWPSPMGVNRQLMSGNLKPQAMAESGVVMRNRGDAFPFYFDPDAAP